MKKKIIFISSLDDAPDGAEFPVLVPDQIDTPDSPPAQESNFVKVVDGAFNLSGERIKFAGTNGYYLPTYEKQDPKYCNAAWNLFSESGVNLVRTWGFYDGPPQHSGDPSFQTFEDGEVAIYNEEGLKCLDRTVAKASEKGIYLLIALTNYHPELGGYREYCKAVGIREEFHSFIVSNKAQVFFKEYINELLNRVNTVTGVAYKDEPYILGWEICNEARNKGTNPGYIRDWYQDIAKFIKSVDTNHLVATGEDGFEDITTGSYGTDGKVRNQHYSVADYSNTYVLRAGEGTSYLLNTEIPEIDFGSFHWYPSDFGFGYAVNHDLLRAQQAWIKDHSMIAAIYGKPVILGEYGFHINWMPALEVYSPLWREAAQRLDGALLWQFVPGGVKTTEYGGNIGPGRGPDLAFIEHLEAMKQG